MPFRETELKDVGMIKAYPVEGHAESYLPKDKKWKLVWNDEFDGDTLDESKWMYRLNFWGKKHPSYTDKGVHLDGKSHMYMDMVIEDGKYKSAELQTGSLTYDEPRDTNGIWPFGAYREPKFMHRYGYYEICCKLPKGAGWHAAFWLQSPSVGAHPNPEYAGVECDIMESYRQHTMNRIICGNGWGGYGKDSRWFGHFSFPYEETEDGWHRYAVDWSENGYIFYADGKEVGRQIAPECAVSKVEQFILVTTETHGYLRVFSDGAGTITKGQAHPALESTYPDTFIVDYVRVFDEDI
ncbi:MAG: family 16 glycosylhydrolase [Eubacteriales bacterium]